MPFSSTLVASWWSILLTAISLLGSLRGGGVCTRREFGLHVVGEGNLALLVANDGESDLAASDLVNVVDPSLVRLDGVGGQADQLDAALLELGLELGKGAELGGADGGVVLGVGEEDDPVVANELVEVNRSGGGLGLEVGGDGAETERSGLRHDGWMFVRIGMKRKKVKLGLNIR